MYLFSRALIPLILSVSACSTIPSTTYYNRGSPESLLDVSSEIVNLSVSGETELDELSDWVHQDQPSRAELYCAEGNPSCTGAQEVLDLYGVPSTYIPAADNVVSLVYERVLARDCENRYIDNATGNPYNMNHPTFGCSVAVNMVQMVSDKHQFVRPNLLDLPDAAKAVNVYNEYLNPSSDAGPSITDSLLDEAETQ